MGLLLQYVSVWHLWRLSWAGALLCPCVTYRTSSEQPVCLSVSNSWKCLLKEGKTQGFRSSIRITTNVIIKVHPVPSTGGAMAVCNLGWTPKAWSRSLPLASVTLGEFTNLSITQFSCPGSRANISWIAYKDWAHSKGSKGLRCSVLVYDPEQVPHSLCWYRPPLPYRLVGELIEIRFVKTPCKHILTPH